MNKLEKDFIDKKLYYGLTQYAGKCELFSKDDFKTIIDRAKECKIGINGIEAWSIDADIMYGVETIEEYDSRHLELDWAKKAMKELYDDNDEVYFSATFFIPIDVLTSDTKILKHHIIKNDVTILFKHKPYKLKSLLELSSNLFRAELINGSKMTLESDEFKIVNPLLYS